MKNHEKAYTAENITAVFENIVDRKAQRQTCSYRIQVDGITIVKRTYNLSEFYSYRHSLTPETKTISITIYGRFAPVEIFELKRVDSAAKVKSGYNPNEELAYENIRLFSEGLDKDVQIFELRERLARAEVKKETSSSHLGKGVELIDIGNAFLLVMPKQSLSDFTKECEKQWNEINELFSKALASLIQKK
jgi:hypothetical protein